MPAFSRRSSSELMTITQKRPRPNLSHPPCGEGAGVGVTNRYRYRRLLPTRRLTAPTSASRGGKEHRPLRNRWHAAPSPSRFYLRTRRHQPNALAVEVTNASEPVLCAEKDNVTLNLSGAGVKAFRIEAAHPAYIGALQRDSFEADWTACDMSGDPAFAPPTPPRRVTAYEEIEMWVVGLTFPTFWRPATATLRIGDRVEKGLHLIQVWMIRPMGGEEVLVLYPQDGYWRMRPQGAAGMAPTAFGSSFLVGPIEQEGRPIVRISEVVFEPKTRTFTLHFERGGSATVEARRRRPQPSHASTSPSTKPVSSQPFAALRSMYVTDFNNDVARVAVREKGRQRLARRRHHDLQARHRHRSLGRPHRHLAPQHILARHGVLRLLRRHQETVTSSTPVLDGANPAVKSSRAITHVWSSSSMIHPFTTPRARECVCCNDADARRKLR